MKPPFISIILPSYNGEKYIAQSIQSVIDQTEQDWELIIVNDCSTDNTLKICESFAKHDKRIKIISNKINRKLPASLNIGFAVAKGKYFTWTSDDNWYKPNALKKMSKYLEKHFDIDLISMGFDYIDENDEFIEHVNTDINNKRCEASLILDNNVGAAFMYRKSIADKVGEYDTNTFCAEDYDYWCRIALAGKIGYVFDNIYVYRMHSNSLTATKQVQIKEKTKYIQKKYARAFFDKFKFTLKDQELFYIRILNEINLKYALKIFGQKIYKFFVKIFCCLIFYPAGLRRKIRAKLLLDDNFSFLK